MNKFLLRIMCSALFFAGTAQFATALTVKFQPPAEWTTVFVYGWGESEAFGGWPGTEMTLVDGWYTITDEALTASNIIFNNNSGVQTINMYVTADACFESTGNLVGTEVEMAQVACTAGGIEVKFQKPASWTQVYIYGYINDADAIAGWPGVLLSEVDGWYAYTLDGSITEINLIYTNNGGEQTADVYVTENSCFVAETDLSMTLVSCEGNTGLDSEKAGNFIFYPNPAEESLKLQSAEKIKNVYIYSLTGACVKSVTRIPESGIINISDLNTGMYIVSLSLVDGQSITKKLTKK